MIWRKYKEPKAIGIQPVIRKKQIKVLGFTVNDYEFGEIKSYDAIITLQNFDTFDHLPSSVWFLTIDCSQCIKKDIGFSIEAFDLEQIDTPIQLRHNYFSETPCIGVKTQSIIVSTSREKLYALRKELIESALEDLTHAKAIARLKKQLAEIEEENSDET